MIKFFQDSSVICFSSPGASSTSSNLLFRFSNDFGEMAVACGEACVTLLEVYDGSAEVYEALLECHDDSLEAYEARGEPYEEAGEVALSGWRVEK